MQFPFSDNYNHWNGPRRTIHPKAETKIISIPVHFVGSEDNVELDARKPDPDPVRSRPDAAGKIQKVFRGFKVRKAVKKIMEIRSDVEEMERRIQRQETEDLIRRDAKERLRLNETLMSLLFRLDSVLGIDSAVRDCRKALTRRVILMQESVDAIVAIGDLEKKKISGVHLEEAGFAPSGNIETLRIETVDENTSMELMEEAVENVNLGSSDSSQIEEESPPGNYPGLVEEGNTEISQSEDGMQINECVKNDGSRDFDTSIAVQKSHDKADDASDSKEEIVGSAPFDSSQFEEVSIQDGKVQSGLISGVEEASCDEKSSGLVVKRMMEANEKLMGLVSELCYRNTEQSQLINELSRRVEQLERAVVKERMRRKKRNAAKIERSMEAKKCERR